MNNRSQAEKAKALLALHQSGDMLVLPNIWNPIGARVLAAKGFPAVATASAAVSASLGYQDGEYINRSTLIDVLARIARSVDVPVTADIETGYGETLSELEQTIGQVIEAGIVGINLEDGVKATGTLRPVDEQCSRIATARQAASRRSVHLVINARVDSYVSPALKDAGLWLEEAATRAKAYAAAGADCIYPIGPGDEATVRQLRQRISAPINILVSPNAAPLAVLREIGVNRVSFGPFVFRTCLKTFVDLADRLNGDGDFSAIANSVSRSEIATYLISEHEPPLD